MFNKTLSYLSTLLLALTLAACAAPGGYSQTSDIEIRKGVIEQITSVQIQSNHHQGVGAVVGGVVGLGLGSLIGNGTGRDVAMVLGTVGGAIAGNQIQKKNEQPIDGQQIIVRIANGVLVSITQPFNPSLRKNQRVYIEGNGENARVAPQ